MRLFLFLLTSAALTGCVSTKEFPGPNGERAFLTKCNGGSQDLSDCYSEAAKQCAGKGYNILNTVDGSNGAVVSGNMIMAVNRRELTYTCK